MPKSIDVKLDLRDTADYRLVVPDKHAEVVAGTTAEYVVNVDRVGSYDHDVILEASGTPSGSTPSFSDSEISVGESSVFSIGTTGVTPGTYSLSTINSYEAPEYGSDYDWLLVDNASRLYDWETYCGIPGGIPARTTIYQTFSSGATAAQIQSAITSAMAVYASSGIGQVVYLNAGTYSWGSGTVQWPRGAGVTLRGAGPGQTIITASSTNVMRNSGTAYNHTLGSAIAVSSGYEKGSMAITLASTPSANYIAGNIVAIIEDGSPNKFGTGIGTYARDGLTSGIYDLGTEAATRPFKYLARITSVSGNTVNIACPLPLSFSPSLNIRAYSPNGNGNLSLCGIENLTFSGCPDPVKFYMTDRFWFKDIEFYNCPDGDIGFLQLNTSVQFEIRRCYLHHAPGYPNEVDGMCHGTNYGCCNGLFIDNIGYRTSALVENNGAAATAYLYNYAWDQARAASSIAQAFPTFYGHGPINMMNLYEGNVGFSVCGDGYHGSGCYEMIFRNNLNGLHPAYVQERKTINLPRGAYYYSSVGNILGDSSYTPTAYEASGSYGHEESFVYCLGYPNTGNSSLTPAMPWTPYPGTYPDANVKATLFRHGNYDYYNEEIIWTAGISSHDIPESLVYSSKPSFFGSLTWPAIGPDLGTMVNPIPAKSRWDAYVISSDLDDLFTDQA